MDVRSDDGASPPRTRVRQFLVRFRDRTHVIDAPLVAASASSSSSDAVSRGVLFALSGRVGVPVARLSLDRPRASDDDDGAVFRTARLARLGVRGGKGGFGTLLKNQSKRSGAKTTIDFGACRDLRGRRLRHANDSIKLRLWREEERRRRERESVGGAVPESDDHAVVVSGWHLDVPTWAEVGSEKARRETERRARRELRREREEEEARREKRRREERRREVAVSDYADAVARGDDDDATDAVRQGLRKRRRAAAETSNDDDDDGRVWLCALSGDALTAESPSSVDTTLVEGRSDFATVAALRRADAAPVDYFEVVLGDDVAVCQIGYADLDRFDPRSDAGEGVGDDAHSHAYDPVRNAVFRAGTERPGPADGGRAGGVVGCRHDPERGEISYSRDGRPIGVTLALPRPYPRALSPAISLHAGETVGLRTGPRFQYRDAVDDGGNGDETKPAPKDPPPPPPTTTTTKTTTKTTTANDAERKRPPTVPETLDLSPYDSADALAALGPERLKSALLALGVKCGGSLRERAERLFSLKGLSRNDYPAKVRTKHFQV